MIIFLNQSEDRVSRFRESRLACHTATWTTYLKVARLDLIWKTKERMLWRRLGLVSSLVDCHSLSWSLFFILFYDRTCVWLLLCQSITEVFLPFVLRWNLSFDTLINLEKKICLHSAPAVSFKSALTLVCLYLCTTVCYAHRFKNVMLVYNKWILHFTTLKKGLLYW